MSTVELCLDVGTGLAVVDDGKLARLQRLEPALRLLVEEAHRLHVDLGEIPVEVTDDWLERARSALEPAETERARGTDPAWGERGRSDVRGVLWTFAGIAATAILATMMCSGVFAGLGGAWFFSGSPTDETPQIDPEPSPSPNPGLLPTLPPKLSPAPKPRPSPAPRHERPGAPREGKGPRRR